MALYVYKSGVHRTTSPVNTLGATHNINYNTPTNPLIKDTGSTGATYICAEIRNDNSSVTTMEKITTGAYNVYSENLAKTPGYRVRTFFNETQTGQQYNSINLTTHDYFILLYADDPKQHHFAKITAEITDDVEGDTLEFQPKLGNEVPKGTKFIVFKGPAITDTAVVAVTAGLLVDSDTRHHTSLIVSRPLFHFYNDRLNKPNELDHSTKYKLCYANGTATSIALSTISVFVTTQDAHFKIIDKSKYQLSATLIDNRRTMDDPSKSTDTNFYYDNGSISGSTSQNCHTDWNKWSLNARRDANDNLGSGFDMTGPIQYIHYEDSPNQLNRINDLYHSKIFNTIKDRTGIAECKFIDTKKVFTSKNAEGDAFTIREQIEELNLKEWHETELSLDSITSGSTTLKFRREGNYDARVLWGQHEEIKIGNYIGFINTISAPSSDLHTVVCQSYWRLEGDSIFTNQGSAPFSVGDKIYRRKWSPKTRTLMTTLQLDTDITYTGLSALTDHPLDIDTLTYKINNITLSSYTESRFNNCHAIFLDRNYTQTTVPIKYGDKVHSCFRLEPERTHYRTVADSKTSLDYAFGKCAIELEIFDGTIEELTEELEGGQPIIEIVGRDNFAKLVSPIINKNTLFTQDMIHSSFSPIRRTQVCLNISDANITVNGDHDINSTSITLNSAIEGAVTGTLLYDANNNFVGIVKTAANPVVLEFGSSVRLTNGSQLFRQIQTPYTFKKALQASSKNSESVSSLEGAANRGIFFNSGISVDKSTGVKEAALTGSSKSPTENAVGYNFDAVSNIKNDRAFQALLKDDVSGEYFKNRVVNGLSDFIVVSKSTEDKQTVFELAPRVGLYLGRVEDNDVYDSDNITTTDTTMRLTASSYAHGFLNTPKLTTSATAVNTHFKRNDPVFIKVAATGEITFAGYFIRTEADSANAHHIIFLDREVTYTIGSATTHEIHKLNAKQTTDMYFLNRPASMIQLASPFVSDTWGLLPFNIHIHDTASSTITTDYITRYGAPYYRFLDLQEGIYNALDEYPLENDQADEDSVGVYYDNPSKTKYYALTHRFKNSYLTNTPLLTNSRTDDSSFSSIHELQGMFEKRGNKPSRGTNFFDYYLTGNTATKQRYPLNVASSSNNRTWERKLRQMDSKVSRNFLFTTCDLLPESDLRKESLYYGARDLTEFSILLQRNGTKSEVSQNHTNYLGGGTSLSNSDDETFLAQISSAPSINNLKKFSMLRLVEMTLDWHFNSVDAENLPSKERTLQVALSNKMGSFFVVKNGSTNLTIASGSGYGSNSIVFSNTPDNLTNNIQYTFYTENGHRIGLSAASQTYNSATVNLTADPYPNENNIQGALSIVYAFSEDTDDYEHLFIRGHGKEDTFTKHSQDGEIHMLKGAVFQNDNFGRRSNHDGYSEDNGDDYHESFLRNNDTSPTFVYSLVDNVASAKPETFDIALPPTFRVTTGTRSNLAESDGTRVYVNLAETVDESEPANFALSGTPNITDGIPYYIYNEKGYFFGKTVDGQTYSSTLSLEKSFLTQKLVDNVTNFVADQDYYKLEKSTKPDESLIHTEGNTHFSEVLRAVAKFQNRNLFNQTLAVFLDRYDIEDGGQASISAGMTSSQITEHAPLLNNFHYDSGVDDDNQHKIMLRRNAQQGFAHYKNAKAKVSADGNEPFQADGAYMLFKPYLLFQDATGTGASGSPTNQYSSVTTIKAAGDSSNVKKFTFVVDALEGTGVQLTNSWLNYAPNLTGCYLVSFHGKEYGIDNTAKDAFSSSDTTNDTYDSLKGMGETVPSYIHYVISHTITRTSANTVHEIVIDNASTVGRAYKVMRVAENTFYDFTPEIIKPYCFSPTYTKMAYEEQCYEEIKSYKFRNIKGSRETDEDRGNGSKTYQNTGHGEGVGSMYVIADPSNKGDGTHLVYRTPSACFGDSKVISNKDVITALMADGNKKQKTTIECNHNAAYNTHEFKFSDMANMVGATSIGETFTLKTIENIRGNYSMATIGCGVNVCFESDDLLNDLFEDEGLEFEKQDVTEYPLFISPEYKGVSLLAAADFILDRKDRRLIYDKKFLLRDGSSELNKPKIFINEDDPSYSVRHIKRGKRLFNVYNEIIVYGRNVKATRKNLRSIKKIGKKSLELIDENLYTQYDAERKASSLLSLHSRMSNLIELEVRGSNLFILKAGDVISLDFTSQNIQRDDYLIIEMEYTLDGFVKLKLGEYSKGLEDRFSELLLENTKLKGLTRTKTFKEPTKSNNFFETFKIKEIRIKARKRVSTGGNTIGFGTTLNTGTTPLGFTGGSTITYIDIFEEEL